MKNLIRSICGVFVGVSLFGGAAHSQDSNDIVSAREVYIIKKGWMAPEDMDLVGRAMPASTAGLDPFERRGAIEAGLKKLHISGDVIAVLMKRLASERTILHEWDFDYIRKRFEIYRGEMARDKDWQKIDAAFRRSLAGNGVREGLESLKGYHCNYDESKK